MDLARSIDGWMNESELQWLYQTARQQSTDATWVEVGVWRGRSFAAVAVGFRGMRLVAVDNFCGKSGSGINFAAPAHHAAAFERTLTKLWQHAATPAIVCSIPLPSVQAVQEFLDESVDVVFVDGDHSFDAVTADLKAWMPKIKCGGLLCGHDYPEVRRALEVLDPPVKVEIETIWSWRKR